MHTTIHRTDLPGVVEVQWSNGDRYYGKGWTYPLKAWASRVRRRGLRSTVLELVWP